jgi:hypothetical protein
MSYDLRLLILLLFIGIMLLVDLKNPPQERHRARTYSFILLTGAIGALFGMSVDMLTSQISVDYFVYGKGLSQGQALMGEILALGAKAGFSAAILGGCLFAYFNKDGSSVAHLYKYIPVPLLGSLAAALLFGAFQYYSETVRLNDAVIFFGEHRARFFTLVWVIHIGVYVGAVLGLIGACYNIRKER